MKIQNFRIILIGSIAIAAAIFATPNVATANQVVNTVTGTVSRVDDKQITVNGVVYSISGLSTDQKNRLKSVIGKKVTLLVSPSSSSDGTHVLSVSTIAGSGS